MNKKKAIAIISKSRGITLYQNIDGSSWLSNGYVLYNMGKFPHCENDDEVASVLGLTEKQTVGTKITIADQFPFDLGTMEKFVGLYPDNFSITTGGRDLCILSGESGSFGRVSAAVDSTFLKPFDLSDVTTYNAYFINNSIALIAVVYGIITVGYICPQHIDSDHIEKMIRIIRELPAEVSDDVQL